jgi:hypothetical protein
VLVDLAVSGSDEKLEKGLRAEDLELLVDGKRSFLFVIDRDSIRAGEEHGVLSAAATAAVDSPR